MTSPWPTHDATLRKLWTEGHSIAEIGRRMGLSKNAVVGRAHRLDLPSRETPIRRGDGPTKPPKPRVVAKGAVTPPKLAVVETVAPEPPTVEPTPLRAIIRAPATRPCCFPLGHPETPSFRFCEADGVPGKPYCEAHCAVAYQRVPNWIDNPTKTRARCIWPGC
jgi:GcrA cell cycle regulator